MRSIYRQRGYALLLMVVVLMGLGGVVAGGFVETAKQSAEAERYKHNQRMLEEAKRALLMYAYNYPDIANRGPGRLPCPDIDNDGLPGEDGVPVPNNCIDGGNPMVGRLPWALADLNLNDLRDASNQRLWYAVSSSFDYTDDDVVNSNTLGTITLHGQSGKLVIDDTTADTIAAVIIAPNAEITRNDGVVQDRSVGNGDDPYDAVADDDDGIVNPVNYLDRFFEAPATVHDNVDFVNNTANGFVLGPIFDANGDPVVNDQLIYITARELTAVAERRVLQEYRTQIDAYHNAIWPGAPASFRYPWLNDYDDIVNLDTYLMTPGAATDAVGRVPYLNFYTDHDSHTVVMDLIVDYDIDFDFNDTADPWDIAYFEDAIDNAIGARQLDISNALVRFDKRNGGADNRTDNRGTLVVDRDGGTTINGGTGTVTVERFFWDGCPTCDLNVQDGWELCPLPANDPGDCARDDVSPFNWEAFSGDWNNHASLQIRRVLVQITLDDRFEIGFDYGVANSPQAPAAPTGNPTYTSARRQTQDLEASVTDLGIEFDTVPMVPDPIDFMKVQVTCEYDDYVGSNYNAFYLGNADSGTFWCNPTLTASITYNVLDITADYYPELPLWVSLDQWNDSILLAHADGYKPGGVGACGGANPPCLTINNTYGGNILDSSAVLIAAGAIPTNLAELENVFDDANNAPDEDRNAVLDLIYDANPQNGDDALLELDDS